jgi:ABC-2 type transport system ATP-binding protein
VLDTLVGEGATILLTTQYLEEADRLAREILVVDHGQVIARGDARRLKREVGGDQLVVVTADPADLPAAAALLERAAGAPASVDQAARTAAAPAEAGMAALAAVATALHEADIAVEDVGLRQPTLDDVFLTLTGTAAEPAGEPAGREPEGALR